jgi:hypothetical protein
MLKRRGLFAARMAFAGAGLAFILTMFLWAASQAAPIATYNYFPPGLVFYAQRPIDRCRVPDEIPGVLSDPKSLLITRADRLEELSAYLPEGTQVLARRQRFLRQHDIVILGQKEKPLQIVERPGGSERY